MRLMPRFLGVARNDEGKNVIQSGAGVPPKIETQLRYHPNEVRISPNRRLDITCAQRRYHCCVTTISLLRNYGLKHVKRCGIMKFANELRFGKIRL